MMKTDAEGKKTPHNVTSHVWLVYLKTGDECTSSQAVPMFKFEGSPNDDEYIAQFKGLKQDDDPDTGDKVIYAETILAAPCPENKKQNLKTIDGVEKYVGPDGAVYDSYGEYLIEQGTRNAEDPELWAKGSRAIIKANLPISDGIQEFKRLDKDGNSVTRANGKTIVQRNLDVTAIISYNKLKQEFRGDGGCTPYQQLRAEINRQLDNDRLRLIDVKVVAKAADEEIQDAGQD